MTDSFIVFNAECVNMNHDSICRLAFTPVINNQAQSPKLFYINPESFWDATTREIDMDLCLASPKLSEIWQEIEKLIEPFDIMVSSADGYSARVLWYHLKRLGIQFKTMEYLNAKALCRNLYPDEFSYSYDILSAKYCREFLDLGDAETVTNGWANLLIREFEDCEESNLREFAQKSKLKIGKLDVAEFIPSITKKDYSGRNKKVDFSDVEINADVDHPFFDKNVVFTGKLEKLTRAEARKLVVGVGGLAPENLTTSTNFLVVGVQDLRIVGEKGLSGKMKKAAAFKEKGAEIELIDENDFFEMMNYK